MKYIMYFIVFCVGLGLNTGAMALIDPFSAQNFQQNIRNYMVMLRQLKEASEQVRKISDVIKVGKDQLAQIKDTVKIGKDQLDFAKENLTKIKNLNQLKNNLKEMRKNLKKVDELHSHLSALDKSYSEDFAGYDGSPRPTEQENELAAKRVKQTLKSNQRAIDSLSLMQSYEKEQEQLDHAIESSNNATGMMQATQSTNNMLAMMAQNEHEMKLLLSHSLEQRTLAVSQEQLDKDWSYKESKRFFGSKTLQKKPRTLRKLPDLRKGRSG